MAIRLLSSESINGALTLTGNLTGTSATLTGSLTGTSATFNTGAGNVGLAVYTSAISTAPNVKFGRNANEYIGFKIQDRNNRIVFGQDETDGNHEAVFDIWSSTPGNRAFVFGASDSAGATFLSWLTIENANAIFAGTLTVAGGVVMNGNQTVQGNLTVDGTGNIGGTLTGDNFILGGSDDNVYYGVYRAGTETREVRLVSYAPTPNSKVQLGMQNADYSFNPALTVKADLNVGIGTTSPFANATTNTGLNVDTGGHSSLLIGDGINDGGMIQSSDDSQRIIIGANVYDSPTGSWSRWNATGAALIDVYGEANSAFISLNVDDGTSGFPPARLFIDGNGYVGIGTTTPDNKLQVVAGNSQVQAWFGETSYTNAAIRIGGENAAGGRIYIQYDGDSSYIDCYGGHGSTQRYRDLAIAAQNTTLIGNVIGFGKNYTTSQGWLPGAAGTFSTQTGYYGGDFTINGAASENSLIWGLSAFGNRALQWQTIGEAGNDADGGWNKTINNLPDGNTHGYMSYVYVKRTSSATTGTFYYGCSQVLNLAGNVDGNPYFHVHGIGSLPQDVWCVAIGIIQAYTDTNTTTPTIVGVYRVDTGAKILGGTSFRSQSGVQTTQSHRTYHYYSTDPVATLAFADPGFYVIDGTEPTLNDLLDGSAGGGSSPWTTTGNDIYNNNSGSVGVNNTTPSAHSSDHNQLVVGDGVNNQGMTIFAGSNRESTINFTDTTSSYNNNFRIQVRHDDSSESNNPSFRILYEGWRYVTITEQTNTSNQIPQVRLGPFNSSSLPANLDHSMLEIGMPSGANNPGMVMYGDTQGNSNPFLGMVSTSSSSQITTKYLRFYHNTTLCGTIQKRYNANEVQYLTTSDYRLKEDLKPFKALDTICKINVYNYKWNDIEEDNVNYGVLAHELQELIPEVVAGEKDEVNEKGEEEYQAVDYSKLVPHLIQSIQELKAEIEILKSK
jgi:hypothetical protein